jgi:hypothetical protein
MHATLQNTEGPGAGGSDLTGTVRRQVRGFPSRRRSCGGWVLVFLLAGMPKLKQRRAIMSSSSTAC